MARDGQRFLMIIPDGDANARSVQVVLNRAAALRK
jgi:hypothetical protein